MFHIRPATPEDMFAIVLIKNMAWVQAYQGIMSDSFLFQKTNASGTRAAIAKWQKSVQNETGKTVFFVAQEASGELVGFVFGGEVSQPMLQTDKELHALYVHPARHGLGVGKALMGAFAREMRRQGARTFSVGCLTRNKSLTFYRHLGGEFCCEIQNAHFENLDETFFSFDIERLLLFDK